MTGGRWSGRRAQGGTAQPGEGRRTTSITALRGKRALLDFPAPTTTRPALIARTACPCVANLPRADAVATQFRSISRLLGFAVCRLPVRRPSVFTQMVTAGSRPSSGRDKSERERGCLSTALRQFRRNEVHVRRKTSLRWRTGCNAIITLVPAVSSVRPRAAQTSFRRKWFIRE